MPATRGEWADHIKPGARAAFADEYPELEAQYTQLFNVLTSERAFEDDLVSTGLGTAGQRPEGEPVPTDQPRPRGKVRYTHLGFALGYDVTQEAADDELYGAIVPPSSRFLAAAMRDAEEREAAAIFNNAFSTQQAYDGVSLLNNAHPTLGAGDLANRPATDIDLSVTALQASIERFMDLKTDRGLRIRFNPSRLVHPVSSFWLAREILQSEFKPFTANNEINVLRQMGLTPFPYQYLTDDDSWYVVSDKANHKLNFFWRERPNMDDDFDKKTRTLTFMIFARFIAGVTDWRGIDGSSGA